MKEQRNETNAVETITISRAEYDAQKAQITELKGQNEWLMEQLRLLKKKQFGASSEQTKEQLDGQLSLLFNVMMWAMASAEAKLPGITDGSFGVFTMGVEISFFPQVSQA